jgi:septal ring factor EnvC (AmiA/AmiB activator)
VGNDSHLHFHVAGQFGFIHFRMNELVKYLVGAAVAFLLLCAWLKMAPKPAPSNNEIKLQAELAVWKEKAKQSFYQAAQLQLQAEITAKSIDQLQEQLKNNQKHTNETTANLHLLPADSLAGYVSNQLDNLNTSWY